MRWNHNVHYHGTILRAIPKHCGRALDVGCGQGLLARQMARQCGAVFAIDQDPESLAVARTLSLEQSNLTFVEGDVLMYPFPEGSFDFISVLATLHHLPNGLALERFRGLLRPGGTLAVIGLFRDDTIADRAVACVALPISLAIRLIQGEADVGALLCNPMETLEDMRSACESTLPGGIFRRRFFFRYSFVWKKP